MPHNAQMGFNSPGNREGASAHNISVVRRQRRGPSRRRRRSFRPDFGIVATAAGPPRPHHARAAGNAPLQNCLAEFIALVLWTSIVPEDGSLRSVRAVVAKLSPGLQRAPAAGSDASADAAVMQSKSLSRMCTMSLCTRSKQPMQTNQLSVPSPHRTVRGHGACHGVQGMS